MKKLLLTLLLFLCLAPQAYASVQIISGGTSNITTNAGIRFVRFGMNSSPTTSESPTFNPIMPIAGTFSNFRASATTSPGTGNSFALSLRKNGADTGTGCAITGSKTSCNDPFHPLSVVAGDTLSVSITPAGSTVPPLGLSYSAVFTPTTANETMVFAGGQASGNALSTTVGSYITPASDNNVVNYTAPEANKQIPFAEGGTLDKFYTVTSAAPGAGTNYVFTVRQTNATSSITTTIADAALSASDLVNTLAVTTGDRIGVAVYPSGTPTQRDPAFGLRFVPTTAGDFLFLGGALNSLGQGTTYLPISGPVSSTGVESTHQQVVAAATTIKAINVWASADPGGSGRTRVMTLMVNGVASSLTCTIGSGSTTCSASGSVSVNAGDLLDTRMVSSVSTASAVTTISYAASATAPAALGTTKVIALTSGTSWSVPSDFSSTNMVECIGAGGSGSNGTGTDPGTGGGGGLYGRALNLSLTPASSIDYAIAAGGSGGDTYFNSTATSTSSVSCTAGTSGVGTTKGVAAPIAGSVAGFFIGGTPGNSTPGVNRPGGGGGGSAGPIGAGFNGASGGAGQGGTGGGGGGSNGGSGSTGSLGNGGNGTGGTGGGAVAVSGVSVATAGTVGGGGGAGVGNQGATPTRATGATGGCDTSWTLTAGGTAGACGGGGGSTNTSVPGGNGGTYGGGGAGAGQNASATGGTGGQGIIVITYVSGAAPTPSHPTVNILAYALNILKGAITLY